MPDTCGGDLNHLCSCRKEPEERSSRSCEPQRHASVCPSKDRGRTREGSEGGSERDHNRRERDHTQSVEERDKDHVWVGANDRDKYRGTQDLWSCDRCGNGWFSGSSFRFSQFFHRRHSTPPSKHTTGKGPSRPTGWTSRREGTLVLPLSRYKSPGKSRRVTHRPLL